MAGGPVTFNGVIQRAQDVGIIKHQEQVKPNIDQQNIQSHLKQQVQVKLNQVNEANDADQPEFHYDAKEKGNNEYEGRQKKKKKQDKQEGKVLLKQEGGRFDIKI